MPAGQSFNISDIHSPACASTKVPFCKIGIYKKWKLPAACPAPSQLLTQKQLILVVLAAFKADTPSLLLTKNSLCINPSPPGKPLGGRGISCPQMTSVTKLRQQLGAP